jgi:hypothetical protein
MDRDPDRQEYETWDRVLTNVVTHDHIVQLYQDEWCRRTRFPRQPEGREACARRVSQIASTVRSTGRYVPMSINLADCRRRANAEMRSTVE